MPLPRFWTGRRRGSISLIAKKQRQIELLQEKRAALISHAVTKGLDPNVKMKDSGIEWLGGPDSGALGHEAAEVCLHSSDRAHAGQEIRWRKSCHSPISERSPTYRMDTLISILSPRLNCPGGCQVRDELRPGDVLMTEGGDFDKLGRGHVWEGQISGCLHQTYLRRSPKTGDLRSVFLAAVLTSSHGKNYFTSTSQQTTEPRHNQQHEAAEFPCSIAATD